jgi:uncharacterized protein involved in exopolysaccharide biosynthesis
LKAHSLEEPVLKENAEPLGASAREAEVVGAWTVLSMHRRFVLWCTLGTAILTTIIVFLIPNRYTATTTVMPPTQNSSMSSTLMGQLAGNNPLAALAGFSMKNPGDLYVSLFRGRTVEDAVIKRYGLMKRYHKKTMVDARKSFEYWTSVTLGTKDGLIRVTVTDRDPGLAAQIANSYVEELRKHSDTLAITEAAQRRVFFQQQLLEANGDLARAQEAMKNTQQSTGMLQLDSQARALIESTAILRAQITAKEVQLQSMLSFATENNPRYMMAQQELDALKAQLAKIAGPNAGEGSDFGISRSKISEAGISYLNSLRDVRYYETVEELLAKQFEAAKLDEARQGAVIQVPDVAIPPDKKSSPLRAISVLLATVLGFFAACAWCLFAHQRDQLKRAPRRALEN